MPILETLVGSGTLRFTQLSKLIGGISQKTLTQTIRRMERDGLSARYIRYKEISPEHFGEYSAAAFDRGVFHYDREALHRPREWHFI